MYTHMYMYIYIYIYDGLINFTILLRILVFLFAIIIIANLYHPQMYDKLIYCWLDFTGTYWR